jgi:ubiquinone/menaquinone biosynthesis C-methylase UbiE
VNESAEEAAKRIFGARAAQYTTSGVHTDPLVLGHVVARSAPEPDWFVLDVATGTGHTALALAPYVTFVSGGDLTPEMLAEAEKLRSERGITNVSWHLSDVHRLPFGDETFHLVTCRRAAHHFSQITQALAEMKRVLRPGGRLVIDDRSVPEDDFVDACMNELDRYHDESHVRQYRPSEWRQLLETLGFTVKAVEPYTRHRPLTSLTEGVSGENVQKIRQVLDRLGVVQREALNLVELNGQPYLNHWYVMVAARLVLHHDGTDT